MVSEPAYALITQATPHSAPPISTTARGPYLSTNQPSTGTSQVSSSTNSVNATWMSLRLQPCLVSIGVTNRVQPYWRLAIIDMQTMPNSSWSHRLELLGVAPAL